MPSFCRQVLSKGSCAREGLGCKFRHDVRHCEICQVYVIPSNWESHVNGRKHKLYATSCSTNPLQDAGASSVQHSEESVSGESRTHDVSGNMPLTTACVRCDACGITLQNTASYELHKRSTRHAIMFSQLLTKAPTGGRPVDDALVPAGYVLCKYCNWMVDAQNHEKHESEDRHIRRKRAAELDAAFEDSQKNKAGVIVSDEAGVDFGIIEDEGSSIPVKRCVKVEKIDTYARIALRSAEIRPHVGIIASEQSNFKALIRGRSRWVNLERPLIVEIIFKSSYAGRHGALLVLTFHSSDEEEFTIIRELYAIVGSVADREVLKPVAPYVRLKPQKPPPAHNIHPGRRPVVWSRVKWNKPLLEYKVPKELADVAFEGRAEFRTRLADIKRNFAPKALSMETYHKYFQVSLYLEEENNRRELAIHTLCNRKIEPQYPYYEIDLAGIDIASWKRNAGRFNAGETAEAGTSPRGHKILIGDTFLVRRSNLQNDMWYQGVVHKVQQSKIMLRFQSSFSIYGDHAVDVQFVLNRIPFRRAHQAVSNNYTLRRLLFPIAEDRKYEKCFNEDLSFFNRNIGQNAAQRDVIESVLSMTPGCSPLVIFGPPGTGKTSTIVESIKQVIEKNPRARVLACAPSNKAADVLAVRLVATGTASLLRLCAQTRKVEEMDPILTNVAHINQDDQFEIPSLSEIESCHILVCTCVSSAILSSIGLARGHFDFIFIDEAGQATEPESMISVKMMADDYTNVVLCGDPKQLSPIVKSAFAVALGLKQSYLERLVKDATSPLTGSLSGVTIKHLKEHYRSHESIIKISNQEFYNNELIPRGDPAITHSLLHYDLLNNNRFPIVFEGISDRDEQESSSPSFFNRAEASLVKKYIANLMGDRKLRLKESDIGVISPYNAQCGKISQLLSKSWPGIKIGNVEEYQGQERRVVIISTVRSNMSHIRYDLRRNLGFVADPQRFNVAITRAQALLIVIGDPVILSLDPLWRRFLNYVHLNGGWRGKAIDWDPHEDVANADYAEQRQSGAQKAIEELIGLTVSRMSGSNDGYNVHPYDGYDAHMDVTWRSDDI